VPPRDEQNRFTKFVESIERQKQQMRDHLTQLDTLFASLQSRAFNGEL
jgi:type I restriction enzyme S subunit